MTRKLSAITTAKVAILSETTKQMTEKASHASRAEGSKSSFNYEIVLIEALKLLRRQPGGGFCSKRLYKNKIVNRPLQTGDNDIPLMERLLSL